MYWFTLLGIPRKQARQASGIHVAVVDAGKQDVFEVMQPVVGSGKRRAAGQQRGDCSSVG